MGEDGRSGAASGETRVGAPVSVSGIGIWKINMDQIWRQSMKVKKKGLKKREEKRDGRKNDGGEEEEEEKGEEELEDEEEKEKKNK